MTGPDGAPLDEVAAALREVLAGIDSAPDTTADPLHIAYLHGAADVLAMVAGVAEGERPEANEPGHDVGDGADVRSRRKGRPVYPS
ncbi:MAG: hypothetical protein L0H64_11110 [Pseudonocardia sp.]|nr:hypothetical protein [Pseudonocardia sp.]